METSGNTKTEVTLWLESVLSKENLTNISVDILGNSEKGNNYIGDIIFVHATGITPTNTLKEYDLVVKCSKKSDILREKTSIQQIYLNEIYMYAKLFPNYTQFQLDAGIDNVFDSIPKCYGTFVSENREVIVLENLMKQGYYLWDKKKPMPRKYISLVVREYGKFHAVSAAMAKQQPKKFEEVTATFKKMVENFEQEGIQVVEMFKSNIEDIYNLLKDTLDEVSLEKWRSLKEQVMQIFTELNQDFKGLIVVTHGDCWNNNFMFQSDSGNIYVPTRVAIVDWQISKLSTPVVDLSYFLFTCISEEDLPDLDNILDEYYQSFSNHLEGLGSNADAIYPKEQFLNEWEKYSKFGALCVPIAMKVCIIDADEAPDIVQSVEDGGSFMDTFTFQVRDENSLRKRISPIIKYVAETGLI